MFNRLSPGILAAAFTVLVGGICILLAPIVPWLTEWPGILTIPANKWIGGGATWAAVFLKPVARGFSFLLSFPMQWVTSLLIDTPYPLIIGGVTALACHLAGWRLTLGVLLGLGFVLASGYWVPGMTTLALVTVSAPLALFAGGTIGLIAHQMPSVRRAIETLLDVMQTIPTFAYLTPLLLLLGFGPVVGLIASAIYATPPIARNVMLGLDRVDPEIREAAAMSGANRWQQLFLIEIPSASQQIMVGVNQTIMAALSMVIIAAVIGGFNDIGWAVLLTMRKADFGNSLVAGMVIVIFAIVIDRITAKFAETRVKNSAFVSLIIPGVAVLLTLFATRTLPAAEDYDLFAGFADRTDAALGHFTGTYGNALVAVKNNIMFYTLLPLRIGLSQAVLPMTWGFQWTGAMSVAYFASAAVLAAVLTWRQRPLLGLMLLIVAGVLHTGVSHLPWPFVLFGASALGWVAGGRGLAVYAPLMLLTILVMGLWEPALLSIYLSGSAVLACTVVGGLIGFASAISPAIWRVVRPICDLLQTIPLFVFLIPVLMFFQIGEFSAFLAICAYAVVPMIRYSQQGLVSTPEDMIEAAVSSGATKWAIMREVRGPYAAPSILLGLNQTILYAFSMLVIAALLGTNDLGQLIYLALGQGDVGLGISAGAAMAILALVADRMVQGFARERRAALGL